ncbi:PTS sugar transporter subunit IIA [Roseovarius pacificus]|uniref:PTS sugar transporter subunit IIA n=1 Tax=Roseovarius pacificus TaxID=337701 RepID=UPI003749CE80
MLSQELDTVPLSRLTEIDLIVTDIQPGSKEDILRILTQPLFERGVVDDPELFVSGLMARESMMSTGVGGGIALPHLRNPQNQPVDRPLIVIGICPKGTEWDSIDRFPANLFLLPLTGNEVVQPENSCSYTPCPCRGRYH